MAAQLARLQADHPAFTFDAATNIEPFEGIELFAPLHEPLTHYANIWATEETINPIQFSACSIEYTIHVRYVVHTDVDDDLAKLVMLYGKAVAEEIKKYYGYWEQQKIPAGSDVHRVLWETLRVTYGTSPDEPGSFFQGGEVTIRLREEEICQNSPYT